MMLDCALVGAGRYFSRFWMGCEPVRGFSGCSVGCGGVLDAVEYSMADIGLSAFAVLSVERVVSRARDGAEKQDCECKQAKRWLVARAERVAALRPAYLDDDLFCSQPMAAAVLATDADFLFACKKHSHKTLYEYVEGAPLKRRAETARKPGNHSLTYTYRWTEGVRCVNWLAVRIANANALPALTIAALCKSRWQVEFVSSNGSSSTSA